MISVAELCLENVWLVYAVIGGSVSALIGYAVWLASK